MRIIAIKAARTRMLRRVAPSSTLHEYILSLRVRRSKTGSAAWTNATGVMGMSWAGRRFLLGRGAKRDRFALIAAIDGEIRAIHSEDRMARMEFAQPNDA